MQKIRFLTPWQYCLFPVFVIEFNLIAEEKVNVNPLILNFEPPRFYFILDSTYLFVVLFQNFVLLLCGNDSFALICVLCGPFYTDPN